MSEHKPHKFNKDYMEHPDYAIRILEHVALTSIQNRTKELQKTYGVELQYFFELKQNNDKPKQIKMIPGEVATVYTFLPVFLSTSVHKTYNLLFPETPYPIGLCLMKSKAMLGSYPTIKNLNNFGAILQITNYEINKMIDKLFVQGILPLSNYGVAEINLDNDQNLQKKIIQTIKDEKMKEVGIDLTYYILKYEDLIIKSTKNEKAYSPPPSLENHYELDLFSIINIIHAQKAYFEPESIELVSELDLESFIQPEHSSNERYKEYVKQQRIDSIRKINTGAFNQTFSYN